MDSNQFGVRAVVCSVTSCKFGKTPCVAHIDEDINIDKFNECFYSNIRVKWREAKGAEGTTLMCVKCKKNSGAMVIHGDYPLAKCWEQLQEFATSKGVNFFVEGISPYQIMQNLVEKGIESAQQK